MKKLLILGSMLALSGIAIAQPQWDGSVSDMGNIWREGNVGIGVGMTSPAYLLDLQVNSSSAFDDGLRINSSAAGAPCLFLNHTSGENWKLQSHSSGRFSISNTSSSYAPLFAITPSGEIYAGPGSGPGFGQFYVNTATQNYAIRSTCNVLNPIATSGYAYGTGGGGSRAIGILGNSIGADENQGGHFEAFGGSLARAVYGSSKKAASQNFGGWFEADDLGTGAMSIGSDNYATGKGIVVAVRGNAYGSSAATTHLGGVFQSWDANAQNIGASGTAMGGSNFNIGILGSANSTNPTTYPFGSGAIYPFGTNIGVYGTAALFGSTPLSTDWAGWFDNNVFINGTGYCNSGIFTSDRKFKKEIKPLENASAIINKLNPTSYYFNTENPYGMNFLAKKQYGFISQEVEEILPDLVENVHKPKGITEDGKEVTQEVDYKGLNYIGFIALLTKGMQEQQQLIDRQQQQINELKALVQAQTGSSGSSPKIGNATSIPVTLSDNATIVLNQNAPNPFAESTVISYNLPVEFTKAQIIFTTNDGAVIKTVTITEKGQGSLTIFGNDLSHGVYTYSLVVDGKTMDTKKMVKE